MCNVIGVMSGTSLDGIDICHVMFTNTSFMIRSYIELPYTKEIKKKIRLALNEKLTISELTSLHYELGYEYSRVLKIAIAKWNLNQGDIDLIANHGQTIYHNDSKPQTINSTMQLGCGEIIKTELKIDVVTDFRAADIALGNKGAPLVQLFDKYLTSIKNLGRVSFLNIGGIANLYIEKANMSFDTGPGNMMINYATHKLFTQDYDVDGNIALKGEVNQDLLEYLQGHNYFKQNQQSSTGREDFGDEYTKSILEKFQQVNKYDIITTLTKFTADSIAKGYLQYCNDEEGIIYVSGGGCYNQVLMQLLQANLRNVKIKSIDELGINPSQKEALAFAYLGYANLKNIKLKTLNGKEAILGVYHKGGCYE